MKCKNCEQELPEGALVCPHCGAEVEWVPEYMSADMARVKLKIQRDEEERLAREREKTRAGTGIPRILSAALAVSIAALLLILAEVLITRSCMSNYGYLKTMAERALSKGDLEKAEEYAERAGAIRGDSEDLTALVQKIDTLKTEDAYVQDS